MKQNTRRTKIISDKDFDKLWKNALKSENENEFVSICQDIKFNKYNITYDVFIFMLHDIFKCAKLSFSEILDQNHYKKSRLSHAFCIPIRTVEDWYSGVNKCPDYIRLMLLRYFNMFNLGKYIKVECVNNYDISVPRIYTVKNKTEEKEQLSIESIEKMYAADLILAKTDYLAPIIEKYKK